MKRATKHAASSQRLPGPPHAGRRRLLALTGGLGWPGFELGLGLGLGPAGLAASAWAAAGPGLPEVLRSAQGASSVLMLRHALAPGTFDPPGFQLGDCSTQRNLDEAGRQQARQIGAWFAQRQLRPARVRSSPWCRCMDTAQLAFGGPAGRAVEAWAALGSPRAGTEEINEASLAQLRAELAAVSRRGAGFEVWVTHMFVTSALVGGGVQSGEGLLLGMGTDGAPRVITRWAEVPA